MSHREESISRHLLHPRKKYTNGNCDIYANARVSTVDVVLRIKFDLEIWITENIEARGCGCAVILCREPSIKYEQHGGE